MKNAAGKPVEGVFEWIDDSQTVEQGAGYAWRFTPDDTEHYNAAEGESVVYPEEKPGSDKEDLAALIEYAQDAKDAENYKYVVYTEASATSFSNLLVSIGFSTNASIAACNTSRAVSISA